MARRALVVGVPHTSYGAAYFPDLPGATRDAQLVHAMLQTAGFDEIVVPAGDGLCAAEIQKSLLKLVASTGPGDLGVYFFSGHGWQFPDDAVYEPDRLHECLVYADMPIVDDWHARFLWPTLRKDAAIVTILDACHSETAAILVMEPPPANISVDLSSGTTASMLFLAACRDEESAVDLSGGVVTRAMLDVLAEGAADYRELWAKVGAEAAYFAAQGAGYPIGTFIGPNDKLLHTRPFAELGP